MKNDQDPKTYTKPTLEKRAKLIDVAEETAPPIQVSGILFEP